MTKTHLRLVTPATKNEQSPRGAGQTASFAAEST